MKNISFLLFMIFCLNVEAQSLSYKESNGLLTDNISVENNESNLISYVRSSSFSKGKLTSYDLDSKFIKSIEGFYVDYKWYVIVESTETSGEYKPKTTLFCDIPKANWMEFMHGASGTYLERFYKYILKYKCK